MTLPFAGASISQGIGEFLCVLAVNPREKENICAPSLALVFAWHRIGAIGAYEKQR
jgi:hypothetical protein